MAIDLIYRNRVSGGNVQSVNGQTGEVVLTAEDVGAIPADSEIVDKVDLTYELASTANSNARKAYEAVDSAQSKADSAYLRADEAYGLGWTNSDNMRRYFIRTPGEIEVGQTIKLASVEDDRTVWEATDFPSGGSGSNWNKVAEFTYNYNTELIVDSFTAADKHLHFTTEHGLAAGDFLLIHDYGIIKTTSIGYTVVTAVVDAYTVMCDSITNTTDFSNRAYKVEKSGGRVLFNYDGLITKSYARLKIEGSTIFQPNENWTFSTYWGSYGGDLLLGEVKDSISIYRSIINIVPATHVGKKEGTRIGYNAGGYAIGTPSESVVITYNTNYSPIPHKQVATPKLVFNGMKIIVEESNEWELL